MQTQVQAPAPPPPPATPIAVPASVQELVALRARRSELSEQLQSAASRRRNLAEQLKTADEGARPGLLQRIEVLDRRIVQLESDIAETGRQLTNAPAHVMAMAEARRNDEVPEAVAILGTIAVGFATVILAFGASRWLWRRASVPPRPALPADAAQRLERIEQAVEAVAIEVERVSEGQRFVTKLLSEAHATPALRAGDSSRETSNLR